MFAETLEEIEAEMFVPFEDHRHPQRTLGMHNIRGDAPRHRPRDICPARIAYKRAHERKMDRERIRAAILAGQRPKSRRTPTRWLDVAKELGIDLAAPIGVAA
jgi:hypothetical protein